MSESERIEAEARGRQLERLDNFEERLQKIEILLQAISAQLQMARGGMKVLLTLITLSAAAGALATNILHFWQHPAP